MYLVLLALVVGSWMLYSKGEDKLRDIDDQIMAMDLQEDWEKEEKMPKLESQKQNIEGQRTFNGILLAFLTAGLVGIVFVLDVLPMVAHKMTHAVYDSSEELGEDPMHDARSLMAQGDYDGAITAFRQAAAADPLNRLPYVEIAKIQREYQENPAAAVQTIRRALESQEWQVSDAAFLMFRLAEIYDEGLHDRTSAASIMQQITEQFPETRHSANARHKLHEWGLA